jgi:carbonic anhydrase/acetyltransferase-like protein (isoleucine patch superfamily)
MKFVPRGGRDGPPVPVVLDPGRDGLAEQLPLPDHLTGRAPYELPITDLFVLRLDHWSNLWMANAVQLLSRIARLRKTSRWYQAGLALRARSLNPWQVYRRTSQIGRDCDIHPTARVEGSQIGDGVQIGAGSVVRSAEIGSGSSIANNATVELSVIGEGCTVMNGGVVQMSTLGPGTVSTARIISTSLTGSEAFLGDGTILTDFRFDGRTISVLKRGQLVDTGNLFLGGCIGHRSRLATGVILAPGRMIPNDLGVSPAGDRVISKPDSSHDWPGYQVTDLAGDP